MTCPSAPVHSQGLWAALSALGTPSEEADEGRAWGWPVVAEGGTWVDRQGEPSSSSSSSHSCQPEVAVMTAKFSLGPSTAGKPIKQGQHLELFIRQLSDATGKQEGYKQYH